MTSPDSDDRDRYDVIASRIFFALLLGGLLTWLCWPAIEFYLRGG